VVGLEKQEPERMTKMRRAGITTLVMTVGLVLGGFFLTSLAKAVTQHTPEAMQDRRGRTFIFFVGEDGLMWYTVVDARGDRTTSEKILNDGNDNNPYALSNKAASGFVATTGASRLELGCSSAGSTICPTSVGIYAQVPSSGLFSEGPLVYLVGDGVSDGSKQRFPDGTLAFYSVIMAPGQEGKPDLWYMMYDLTDLNFATAGFRENRDEPYSGVSEIVDSGFADSSLLKNRCTTVGRTCVGIFVKAP
jgi:hypothetical protein